MKTKLFLFISLFSVLFYLISCDDSVDRVGMGIQPKGDRISTYGDSLDISGTTIKDPVLYAKSITGLLGNFYDPFYGQLKAGYICQFYPTQGFGDTIRIDTTAIKVSPIQIDSIELKIFYTTYVGDSLAPMEVTVYPVGELTPLTENYYTPINPADFADLNTPLGKKVYTARDLNISDEQNLENITGGYYKVVSVPLPLELGQSFYDEYKECLKNPNRKTFQTPEALAKFFPGVYVKSTLGSGCLLEVEETKIYTYYSWTREVEVEVTEDEITTTIIRTDTLTGVAILDVTKEIIQLNDYAGSNDEQLLVANAEKMYIKTPAGIFAQISIPTSEIPKKKFSNVRLSIKAEPPSDWIYNWKFPGISSNSTAQAKMLLIEPDSIRGFFEEKKTANGKTSYSTIFDPTAYSYTFSNIANLIQHAIDHEIDPLVLRLVPVNVAYYNSSGYSIDYASSHYLFPSAVTLKKEDLKIYLLAANLQE